LFSSTKSTVLFTQTLRAPLYGKGIVNGNKARRIRIKGGSDDDDDDDDDDYDAEKQRLIIEGKKRKQKKGN
jgi:hypothetical protein